jgi:hypothetical protein
MSDFITDYGEQLRQAGWRRIERRRRLLRGHLPRRLLVSLAVLAVAAPAVAQTGVWRPLLGDGRGPEPTTSSQPAAERQREILSVLRREQRPADRGAQTAYALRFLGASVSDVHTSSIRLLHVEPDGRGIVLIPVGHYNAAPGVAAAMRPEHDRLSGPDRLCLFAADQEAGRPAGGGFGCYSTEQLLAGRAAAGLGRRTYGLVPDGVARLQRTAPDGTRSTVEVHENVYIYDGLLGRDTVHWIGADGHVIKTLPGAEVELPPAAAEADPATSLCDPAVPANQCASGRYSSPPRRGG